MTVVVVAADKGAPGVTSAVLALGATWPRPCVVVEADPSGGDAALRVLDGRGEPMTSPAPSVLTLAADARTGAVDLRAHAQPTAFGPPIVVGVATPEQAAGVAPLWGGVARAVRECAEDVLVDVGRISSDSPALPLVAAADRLVLVVRPGVEGVVHLRDRLVALRAHPASSHLASVDVVVVAPDKEAERRCADVATVLDHAALTARVAGHLALDEKSLQALLTGTLGGRAQQRSALVRTARALAVGLSAADHASGRPTMSGAV